MPEMAVYWEYVGTCTLPAELPTGVLEEWRDTLKAERTRIYASLLNKIPDETAFKTRIADASSDEFEAFLYKVGGKWDADLIEMKQRVKLARKYPDWKSGVDDAFGVGGYFAHRVEGKADKFKLARYVLGVVGHRRTLVDGIKVWNPVTMGALLMRGDTRCARYFDENDTFTGTLHAVVDPNKGRLITPSIMAEAIRACVMAKFADEGGLTTLRDTILSNSNTVIDELLQVALDATHLGAPYDVTYVLAWDAPAVNVSVTVTDTHPD